MNKLWYKLIFFACMSLFVLSALGDACAQSNIEVFGQNRIQHRKFDWKYFDTKHFRVYHYDKAGRQLGRYVAEEAENDISIIEKKLGGQFPKRFNIMLYNSYDEYRQSNIGLKEETPALGNAKAGTLHLVDDKLVVYFTGEHGDLKRQIRSGMSLVVMQRMIFGENFKKMMKNALLLNLPPWITEGYIAYLVDGWDAKSNSEWKGILDARPKTGFYVLADQYPELAGKAFWKFVSTQYGDNTTKSLLYSMQQKTSLNKAMKDKANLGLKVTKAYDSCIKFYKNAYRLDSMNQEKPDSLNGIVSLKIPKDNSIVKNVRVSPSGADVGYVVWKNGLYTVCTQRTTGEQQVKVIIQGGQKDLTEQIDPDYPMLAWSGTGNKLAILYRKGSETRLWIYNTKKGKTENIKIPPNRFDRALSMAFMQDEDKMVFSAIKKSQTDLYLFTIRGAKVTNITDDAWDDVSPQFMSSGARTGILFLSNRPKPNLNVAAGVNELPTAPLNVFFYNTVSMRPELLQCTNIKKGNISQPIQYGPENFAYLMDSNGINNKYVVMFGRSKDNNDSAYSIPVTNYTTSILAHQYSIPTGDVADVIQQKDKYRVYFHDLQMPGDKPLKQLKPATLSLEKPEVAATTLNKLTTPGDKATDKAPEEVAPVRPLIKGGTAFQSEFTDTATQPIVKRKSRGTHIDKATGENTAEADSSLLTEMTDSAYLKMKPAPYKLSFKPDFLSIKLDNSVIFSQYQSVASNGGRYVNPSLSALTSLSLNELMEDHRLTVGAQLPISSNASAYFVQYQNFRKRMDWGISLIRLQNKDTKQVGYLDNSGNVVLVQDQLFKTVSNSIQSDFSYPFDRRRSLRFHTAVRQDKLIEKITDPLSLNYNEINADNLASLSRLEYVFDNTISPATNIFIGARYKIYAESMYGLNNGNMSCFNIGLDFRNYQKLYKNFILANRLAYAHSDGTGKVEYLVGGTDNWVRPKGFKQTTETYGFQMLATSLRGYDQYARIGNNYAVFTTELRLPLVTTFVNRPVQSALLKNLMLVPFADAGMAWKGGLIPKDQNSDPSRYPSLPNPQSLNNVSLLLTVPNSNSLALGYGAGLRTTLFGYYLRFDAASSIDKPKTIQFYLSLGSDF